MKLYSMTMTINPDHRRRSTWQFDRYWNITKPRQLDTIIKKLTDWTKYDKQGRVLCSGFPSKDMVLQKRLYVVKMGHDGLLWNNYTDLYDKAKIKLTQTPTYPISQGSVSP